MQRLKKKTQNIGSVNFDFNSEPFTRFLFANSLVVRLAGREVINIIPSMLIVGQFSYLRCVVEYFLA